MNTGTPTIFPRNTPGHITQVTGSGIYKVLHEGKLYYHAPYTMVDECGYAKLRPIRK